LIFNVWYTDFIEVVASFGIETPSDPVRINDYNVKVEEYNPWEICR
jgi:hypothetical protein